MPHPHLCQKCWDKGMKRRHNEDKCDPELQAQSLKRMQEEKKRREQTKDKTNNNAKSTTNSNKGYNTKPANKTNKASPSVNKSTRRYPLDQYLE